MARLLVALLCLVATPLYAEPSPKDPTLTISSGKDAVTYTRSELLARPDIETITIKDDPAYPGKAMTYKAVRAAPLFSKVKIADDAVIQFKCLDGFSAPISKERLLNQNPTASVAYIAIEEASAPWPALKAGGPSAGPFYLVWPKPELSFIGQEEWPFQLAAFEVKGTLESLYPKIFPKAGADAKVKRGFRVFTKNCFACHTLNKEGAGDVGPDLNVPRSPTEYMTLVGLKQQIRNTQELRYFPKSRMSSFPANVISDSQVEDLIAYLSYMAKNRK